MSSKQLAPFVSLGALALEERQKDDFYATDPKNVDDLLEVVDIMKYVLEPSVGMGHIAERLTERGHEVKALDIVDRGYLNTIIMDFLEYQEPIDCDVIMNPPFKNAEAHVKHALDLMLDGKYLCVFLKIQFLESKSRRVLFDKYKPERIYVYSERQRCYKDGDFRKTNKGSAMCYAWFIWKKGNHTEAPKIYWI